MVALVLERHRIGPPYRLSDIEELLEDRPRSRIGRGAVGAYSSTDQPMPRPAITRPPLAASRVASDLASRRGMWRGAIRTAVPRLTRVVTAAAMDKATSGSGTEW